MFYECENGRLQNLFLLQNIRVIKNDDNTYSIGWIQSNGAIVKEYNYSTEEEANTQYTSLKSELLVLYKGKFIWHNIHLNI